MRGHRGVDSGSGAGQSKHSYIYTCRFYDSLLMLFTAEAERGASALMMMPKTRHAIEGNVRSEQLNREQALVVFSKK
jgi:hypothetical protein